ncbi:MAG TPA: hypothetical protein VD860_15260 [Azospirillum sp.]|nr:hypothetical protein [Azospirillum sp.]
MDDTKKSPENAQDKWKGMKPEDPAMGKRDEARPGTPGSGENIDPKTGEKFIEGIGGG